MTTKKQFIEDYTNNRESLGMLESLSKLYDKYVLPLENKIDVLSSVHKKKKLLNMVRIAGSEYKGPEGTNGLIRIEYNGWEALTISFELWNKMKRDFRCYDNIVKELINVHRVAKNKPNYIDL